MNIRTIVRMNFITGNSKRCSIGSGLFGYTLVVKHTEAEGPAGLDDPRGTGDDGRLVGHGLPLLHKIALRAASDQDIVRVMRVAHLDTFP